MKSQKVLHLSVIVAALGYFVDIYDLLLFGIVRIPSLRALGVAEADLLRDGVFLLNAQMGGMLVGGLLWGVLGDKRGRLNVMFGSILLYSLANLANSLVSSVEVYGVFRFLAGVGLAGELGVAITLVAETLHTSKRGYGTTLVAGFGLLGAAFAGVIVELTAWRTAYVVGGVLGLALLGLRIRLAESGMFEELKNSNPAIRRGDLWMLLNPPARLVRYLACILVGIPIWFVIAVLVTFAPEFARELGVTGAVTAARSIGICYIGASMGDFASGALSQYIGSRKRVLLIFMLIVMGLVPVFLHADGVSPAVLYFICWLLGVFSGYWAVFMTTATEQFGTNLRATVTTTVPNFVRGAVVPVTLAFQALRSHYSMRNSAMIVGAVVFALGFWAYSRLDETSRRDLDFVEI